MSTDDELVLVAEFAIADPVRLSDDELIRLRVNSAASIVVFQATAVAGELDNLGSLQGSRRREGSSPPSALYGVRLAEVADALSKGAK